MKISTEIASAAKHVGMEKAIELVAAAGFDCWDFSLFDMARYSWAKGCIIENGSPLRSREYAAFAKRLRHIGESLGVTCNQSHAPFPVYVPAVMDMQKRAIECTALAGGSICVIHPDNNKCAEENAEMYLTLLPFAKEHGVRIATENMFNWTREEGHALPAACSHHEDFKRHLDLISDPYFVACVDIGHGEMKGLDTSAEQLIRTLGPYVQALHIHDNNRVEDSHQIPFSMKIDYAPITRALKDIGYAGELTLECDTYLNTFNDETVGAGLKNMARAARRFEAMLLEA